MKPFMSELAQASLTRAVDVSLFLALSGCWFFFSKSFRLLTDMSCKSLNSKSLLQPWQGWKRSTYYTLGGTEGDKSNLSFLSHLWVHWRTPQSFSSCPLEEKAWGSFLELDTCFSFPLLNLFFCELISIFPGHSFIPLSRMRGVFSTDAREFLFPF